MAKLTTIKPLIATIKPRMGYTAGNERERDQHRYKTQPWRKWYNSAAWRSLRWEVLTRDHFTCQMCDLIEPNTSKLVGDHKTPHKGDKALFFDMSNVWTLCKDCHDGVKQREERQGLWIK